MTKEELAKKKGIKIKESAQTAAEALITTTTEIKAEPNKEPKKAEEKPNSKAQTPTKKKVPTVGRPKGKPSTKISLNVPDEYLEIVNIVAGIHYKGNVSSYIVSLIEKDIKANETTYRKIKALTT